MAVRLSIPAVRQAHSGSRLVGVPEHRLPRFTRMSNATRDFAGSPAFSVVLLVCVIAWSAAGFLVDYSRAWELTATTGAPIVALVLLVVIQHTQNRDGRAIQLRLDEMIRASEHASDALIGIEDGPDIELTRLLSDYRRHAGGGGTLPPAEPAPTGDGRLGRQQRKRFADVDLGLEKSFVFRSPGGTLNFQAHNLVLFVRLAETVDDDIWFDHLRRGDFSRWFRNVIRDESLAREAARLEGPDDGRPAPTADDGSSPPSCDAIPSRAKPRRATEPGVHEWVKWRTVDLVGLGGCSLTTPRRSPRPSRPPTISAGVAN